MSLIFEVFIIVGLFTLFSISHTLLATTKIKNKIIEKVGTKIAFYRLFYNVSSILLLIVIFGITPKPYQLIYELNSPYDIIIFILQGVSLVGVFWSASYMDVKEFLGISQIKRYLKNSYNIEELDEHSTMVIKGPFKYTRHPIYFFSICFLTLRPVMDLFYLILLLCIIIYFYIGSIYEEKKLIEKFNGKYEDYQKRVPRMVPSMVFKRKYFSEKK